mmetsp:Transcript_173249/g.555685  ORF Transcript_173249/g.555685 Transcript_173249/m.555685 type:complete len:276 (-) Transcript_173249:2492-3319(-)
MLGVVLMIHPEVREHRDVFLQGLGWWILHLDHEAVQAHRINHRSSEEQLVAQELVGHRRLNAGAVQKPFTSTPVQIRHLRNFCREGHLSLLDEALVLEIEPHRGAWAGVHRHGVGEISGPLPRLDTLEVEVEPPPRLHGGVLAVLPSEVHPVVDPQDFGTTFRRLPHDVPVQPILTIDTGNNLLDHQLVGSRSGRHEGGVVQVGGERVSPGLDRKADGILVASRSRLVLDEINVSRGARILPLVCPGRNRHNPGGVDHGLHLPVHARAPAGRVRS